jgi:6,7-dimethyl-8-ribityllumazine synthase
MIHASLPIGVPILSISLTPPHCQKTDHQNKIFRTHFVTKAREAAEAALQITQIRGSRRPLERRALDPAKLRKFCY